MPDSTKPRYFDAAPCVVLLCTPTSQAGSHQIATVGANGFRVSSQKLSLLLGIDITVAPHETYSCFSYREDTASCFVWRPLKRANSRVNVGVMAKVATGQDERYRAWATTRPTPCKLYFKNRTFSRWHRKIYSQPVQKFEPIEQPSGKSCKLIEFQVPG